MYDGQTGSDNTVKLRTAASWEPIEKAGCTLTSLLLPGMSWLSKLSSKLHDL